MVVVALDVLTDFLKRIFHAAGCDKVNANAIAEGVVEADLRGHHIQGTDHIYSIIADLGAGRLNGRARPHIVRQKPAAIQVDGDGGSGYVGGRFAVEVAVESVRASGGTVVGLVRSGDIFMLGAYVEHLARAGLVGMAFTNTAPARVHPAGGLDPALGTNPIAFAFPRRGADPVIVDVATSTSAVGHIRMATYGEGVIPAGLALDRSGAPTTSAAEALAGVLTPLGGHKGYALALAGALLSGPVIGALVGQALSAQMTSWGRIPERGHTFIAIDPSAFTDIAEYESRTKDYLGEIKAGRKAPGVGEILIPGERSLRQRRAGIEEGIHMRTDVWQHTIDIARTLGVDPPRIAGVDPPRIE
jgi:L-2-hydroxycarboxylate dehydrogenase (NAD+)